ncbi:MAG: hypothetical protein GKS06_09115 [Acidobacteria bacterium]|nr:hypothetical protein [Acidobacteriota bacterium]
MRRTAVAGLLTIALATSANVPAEGVFGGRAKATRLRTVSPDLIASEVATAAGALPGSQAEPHLARSPVDARNLIAGWQEQRFADGGAMALGVARSTDGGRSWASALLPGLTTASGGAWQRATDPWIAFGPDGTAYYSSMTFSDDVAGSAINTSVSTDGGVTWSNPYVVHHDERELSDKQALVVDNSPTSRWQGRLHMAWMAFRYDPQGRLLGQVLMGSFSDDQGRSWSSPRDHVIGNVNTGPVPVTGPGGEVYVVWVSQMEGQRYRQIFFMRSLNGGRRWTAPRRLDEIRFRRELNIREGNDLAALAVDPTTGDLHLLWADRRWGQYARMTLISSPDRGVTWSEPRPVSDDPASESTMTPSIAVDARGHVGISYYRRGNITDGPYRTHLYFRDLGPGAMDPRRETQVTRQPFDLRDAAFAQGYFLGDYSGLAGAPRGFHLLWVDTSQLLADGVTRGPWVRAARIPR